MQQVCFAQTGLTPDEQWVVGPCGCLSDGKGGGVSEPVRGPDDEGVKGVAAVEAGPEGFVSRAIAGAVDEVVRPCLMGAGQRFSVLIDFVEVRIGIDYSAAGRLGLGGSLDSDAQLDALSEMAA